MIKPILLSLICLSFLLPSFGREIKQTLEDEHLQKQCDWAMYLDVQDMQRYFDHPNSKLIPVSRVRVSFRAFPRTGSTLTKDKESKTYEELWYHLRTPIGSKRFMEPGLPEESLGIIVLGPSDRKNKHCEQLTNALLRLMVDLQFKKAATSNVIVPEASYDEIASCLNYYNFWADYKLNTGKRMNIHLCSDSSAREDYFYLGK